MQGSFPRPRRSSSEQESGYQVWLWTAGSRWPATLNEMRTLNLVQLELEGTVFLSSEYFLLGSKEVPCHSMKDFWDNKSQQQTYLTTEVSYMVTGEEPLLRTRTRIICNNTALRYSGHAGMPYESFWSWNPGIPYNLAFRINYCSHFWDVFQWKKEWCEHRKKL